MPPGADTSSIQAIEARFAPLLGSAARLLPGTLQIWTPRLHLARTIPADAPPAATAGVRDLAGRAAAYHQTARGQTPQGAALIAIPLATRAGLETILSAVIDRPSGGPVAGGNRPHHAEVFLEDLARTIAHHLDLLRENGLVSVELTSSRVELDLLHRIGSRLGLPGDVRGTLEFILAQCRLVTAARAAVLALPRPGIFSLSHSPASNGADTWLTERTARRLADQLAERLPDPGARFIHGALAEILGDPTATRRPVHLAAVPLTTGSRREGLLALLWTGRWVPRPHALRLLGALAEQVQLALRGAELYAQQGEFLLSTVRALVSAIEAKDAYTSGHSSRVHLLAMLLGKELGLAAGELQSLQWASILHDIGKIGMPEAILHKPGRLTPEEFDIVKQHAQRGHQVLSHVRQLQDASQAVLLHHERFDGQGYPLGLAGEGIPLAARIIAVADTFDALTSQRSYRRPCTEAEAFAEIRRVRGSQLDPRVVAAFEKMMPFLVENRVMLQATPAAA